MSHLDEIDRAILNILQHEGRISILDLADRVGLSATPCARRVKRFEDEGIIERYAAVLNPRLLGKHLDVFVNVRLRSSTSEAIEIFERAIKSMSEVVECHLVTGTYDYLVHIRVDNIEDFKSYVRERLSGIASVGETVSSIVLEQTKYNSYLDLESVSDKTATSDVAPARR
jgi:Lrp/AsnC family transcriptional regulator, leucine-responsive regulatory protein